MKRFRIKDQTGSIILNVPFTTTLLAIHTELTTNLRHVIHTSTTIQGKAAARAFKKFTDQLNNYLNIKEYPTRIGYQVSRVNSFNAETLRKNIPLVVFVPKR